jgi:hypothetical protein
MILRSLGGALAALTVASRAAGQSGGFVATLGVDTVHIERFARSGNRLEGTIVTRTPDTRIVRWSLTLDGEGRPTRYEVETRTQDGAPIETTGSAGSISYGRDSLVRVSLRAGQMETTRIATTVAALPTPSIPYIGVSYVMYELAFAGARRPAAAPDSAVSLLTMIPSQTKPERRRVWLVGADSAEMSYFGVAKSGYKFDARGQLLRADWTGTTYGYRIARIAAPDVDAIARTWAEGDRRGARMGALSPRDAFRGAVGGDSIVVEYGRPARRGRTIWGGVVPWGKVWRLGADVATELKTSADLRVGGTALPAGAYTLWMLPSEAGESMLIINRQVRIFGTSYNPTHDFARIPLSRSRLDPPVERLTIAVEGDRLWIHWGDSAWSVPVSKPPQ